MATISKNDNGQLVEANDNSGTAYYYVADDFGQPVSGGFRDKDAAIAAFEADDASNFMGDLELTETGEIAAPARR